MSVPIPTPCQVVRVDLASELVELHLDSRFNAAYLCFFYDAIPLNHHVLLPPEFPLSRQQLWNLAIDSVAPTVAGLLTDPYLNKQVQGLDSSRVPGYLGTTSPLSELRNAMNARPEPTVVTASIVVCTRNRPDSLARCLESLMAVCSGMAEIIVVDNAPENSTTKEVVSRFPKIDYEVERRPGLSRARNRGIEKSRGEIIAFTDDDIVVQPNWLVELMRPFHDANVMCVTGLVLPAEIESRSQEVFERHMSFNRGYLSRRFGSAFFDCGRWRVPSVWEIGAGANMAIRRKAFDDVGLFDVRLGAGRSGCSEDSEFWYRLLAGNFTCVYTPMALAWHYHRKDPRDLREQIRLYAKGHVAALFVQFARSRHWGNIVRLAWGLPRQLVRSLLGSIVYRDRDYFFLTTARGYLEGVIFYLVNARHPKMARLNRD